MSRVWHSDMVVAEEMASLAFVPDGIVRAKRVSDIAIALVCLVVTLPLWPLIALAVRLAGSGPVFARKLCVGRQAADRTELFAVLTFRTPPAGIGALLRRCRLDELPKLLNVLHGDMAIVGPRPETPAAYGRFDRDVPFFADRTAGLRPGLTGPGRPRRDVDASAASACSLLAYDTAYALRLCSYRDWFTTDLGILLRTVGTVVGAGGNGSGRGLPHGISDTSV
jgi:lipopolysaccharide/colanic/teichoic acid biosynthesis glycosyltransferase